MTYRRFTEEVETYTVLTLRLDDYKPSSRTLPDGFRLVGSEARAMVRAQEKKVLQTLFEDWDIPYCGKLRGWRDDSALYVLQGKTLAGGLYLCEANEFDQCERWGQLHYFFVEPKFRGKGLHSLLVSEAIRRARSWQLEGVYINTDRHGLPEVYLRWGAKIWKRIRKPSRLPRNEIGNLLRRLRWKGRLAWQNWFLPYER